MLDCPNVPLPHLQRHQKFRRDSIASVDKTKEENSSCVIGWESQTREVKQELLNSKIEEKRNKRNNYHRKLKRLQVGDMVTVKVGKPIKSLIGKKLKVACIWKN